MRLSYSMVSSYAICPRQVAYRLQGVKSPITVPMALGSIFHWAVTETVKGKKPRNAVLEAIAKIEDGEPLSFNPFHKENTWDGTLIMTPWDDKPRELAGWLTKAVEIVADALDNKAIMETPLTKEFQSFTLVGVIDAIWYGRIIDFKLVSRSYRPGRLQAACYALLNGGPTQFEFWVVRKGAMPELTSIPVPDVKDQGFLDRVLADVLVPIAKMIDEGYFPANPDHFLCQERYCVYFRDCPFGSGKMSPGNSGQRGGNLSRRQKA